MAKKELENPVVFKQIVCLVKEKSSEFVYIEDDDKNGSLRGLNNIKNTYYLFINFNN